MHSSTYMVEEAYGYVQGESLKPYATLLCEVFKLPDHQGRAPSWLKTGNDLSLASSLVRLAF